MFTIVWPQYYYWRIYYNETYSDANIYTQGGRIYVYP